MSSMVAKSFSIGLLLSAMALGAPAYADLVIHSTEYGVAKFHRYDNQVHPYAASSAWMPYILPAGVNPQGPQGSQGSIDKPMVQKNADGSYTVFFSTLDDLMSSVIQISDSTGQKVSVLNIHGHGLPGGMWFPKDAATEADWTCADWVSAATGSDQDNYNQYYSAVSLDEIQEIRDMSNNPAIQTGCTSGLPEWQSELAKYPRFKQVFAADAQIHFLSCVVGLGSVGQSFTQGVAALVLPQANGRVETSMDFGLGDWSMPQGMGFWDYISDAQLEHDNSVYVVDHRDSEIAQKGTIRMVTFGGDAWGSQLLANRDFLPLSFETSVRGIPVAEPVLTLPPQAVPSLIRVPGTQAHVVVLSQ